MGPLTPVPRLGVLGGTFDPIHNAHLAMAATARRTLSLDRVLFVPVGDPWRKGTPVQAAAADRLAMVERAIADEPGYAVWTGEVERAGPTYTVDTIAALRAAGQGAIWFILGADALVDLPHWHTADRLVRLVRFAVIERPGVALDRTALARLLPGLPGVVDRVPLPPLPISSTEIRRRLGAGAPVADWLPPPVWVYIRAQRLYGVRG